LADGAAASTITTTVATTITATAQATGSGGTATTSGLVVPTAFLKEVCPDIDAGKQGQQIITLGTKSWRFEPTCGRDYQGDDIGAVIVYSFHDCLQACAAHNYFSGKDECVAVEFWSDMAAAIPDHYGNCWLKNGQGTQYDYGDNMRVAAKLVSSS